MSTKLLLLGVVGAAFLAGTVQAAPIIESTDRLDINWSTLRLRYYGEAALGSDLAGDGYKGAEKRAWQDGLNYANQAIRDLNTKTNESMAGKADPQSEDARKAVRQVAASTTSLFTTYYGNGSVRVHLESSLPKALESSAIHFKQKDTTEPGTQYTGVVIASDQAMAPKAMYQVVDEGGNVLFDIKDMAQEAYRKNLMGHWYKRPTTAELNDSVGSGPVTVKATVRDGKFVVSKEEWTKSLEGQQTLLVNGSIAISLP